MSPQWPSGQPYPPLKWSAPRRPWWRIITDVIFDLLSFIAFLINHARCAMHDHHWRNVIRSSEAPSWRVCERCHRVEEIK